MSRHSYGMQAWYRTGSAYIRSPAVVEARRFVSDLKVRMGKFGLTMHPDKTKLIRFGRFANEHCRRNGEGKAKTFDFLGFTHYGSKTRRNGLFMVGRKSSKKKLKAKLQAIKEALPFVPMNSETLTP